MAVDPARIRHIAVNIRVRLFKPAAVVLQVAVVIIRHHLTRNMVVINRNFVIQTVFKRKFVKRQPVNQNRIRYRHKAFRTLIKDLAGEGCLIVADFPVIDRTNGAYVFQLAVESNRDFVVEAGAGNTPDHNPALVAQLSAFRSDFRSYLAGFAFVVNFAFNHFRQLVIVLAAGSHHRHSGKNDSCCRCKP